MPLPAPSPLALRSPVMTPRVARAALVSMLLAVLCVVVLVAPSFTVFVGALSGPSSKPSRRLQVPSTTVCAVPINSMNKKAFELPKYKRPKQEYIAYISHSEEDETSARMLKDSLSGKMTEVVFLNVDTPVGDDEVMDTVAKSKALVLLQTKNVMQDPRVLMELYWAIHTGTPILPYHVASAETTYYGEDYDFPASQAFMLNLDTKLSKSKLDRLTQHGIDVEILPWFLSSTMPWIISAGFDPAGERGGAYHSGTTTMLSRIKTATVTEPGMNKSDFLTWRTAIEAGKSSGMRPYAPDPRHFDLYLSHYMSESSIEGRLIRNVLENQLGFPSVFLDADDLMDTRQEESNIVQSCVVAALLTKNVFRRGWVLMEMFWAVTHRRPVVLLGLKGRGFNDTQDLAKFFGNLDNEIDANARLLINQNGQSVASVGNALGTTLPTAETFHFDAQTSAFDIKRQLTEFASIVRNAKPPPVHIEV